MESILNHLNFERSEIRELFSKLGTQRAYTFNELLNSSGLFETELIQILNDLVAETYLKVRVNRKRDYYFLDQAEAFYHHFVVEEMEEKLPTGMKYSRHCYKHLAGWLGVQLEEALVKKNYIIPNDSAEYEITSQGWNWFASLGIDKESLDLYSPRLTKQCLDFSERKNHLGGHLGDAVLKVFVDKKWLKPVSESREMKLTELGKNELSKLVGMQL